jgi:hypothetical protein
VIENKQDAELILIAASWYEHIKKDNPELASFMTKEEYVLSFVNIYGRRILVTAALGTNV